MTEFLKKHRDAALFVCVFVLILARTCSSGFAYWPQLDDYIQYHNYAAFSESLIEQAKILGVLAARPLAGLADIFFWSLFFDHMLVGAALIAAMYAGAAVLLRRVFAAHFGTGTLFVVLFALLPLGMEGTYWMSAATRIVTGMFFAALSARFFVRWLRGEGRPVPNAVLYAVLQLIAFGFYEQTLVFSVALTVLLALLDLRRAGRRALLGLWSFAATGLYFVFTGLFSESILYGARTEVVLPVTPYYFKVFLPEVLRQLKCAFLEGGFYTLARGFVHGARLIFSGSLAVFAVSAVLLCAGLFLLARRFPREKPVRVPAALLTGLALTLAPAAPFFITANTWFSLRGTVTSFAGLALLGDTLLRLLLAKLLPRARAEAGLAAALALIFLIAGAADVRYYKETHENDVRVVSAVLAALDDDAMHGTVGVLNIEPSYLPHQTYFYHEHIHGVTESEWAFIGALRCFAGRNDIVSVTPLPTDPMYRAWNAEANRPDRFDRLYFYDPDANTVFPVTLEQTGPYDFEVYDLSGTKVAVIWEEDGSIGYLRAAGRS